MDEVVFDIIDYLGQKDGGIYVYITINYKDVYYDCVFIYREELLVLSVDDKLEEAWGCEVEDWPGYNKLMLDITKKVAPYNELIKTIDTLDKRFKFINE